MTPIEKIQIPSVEPGTPSSIRKCAECKTPINVPLSLFNKLLECPHCQKAIRFKSRMDQAKETTGCLGGCLVMLLLPCLAILLAAYTECPPWRCGWLPIHRSKEAAPDAISLAEQSVAAIEAEKKAVSDQKEILEKMATMVPEQSAQVREQVRLLQSREDELARKQRAMEDLLAELRQKGLKNRN